MERAKTGTAWVRRQKDGIASDVLMRTDLRDRMSAHGPAEPHQRVFRFHQGEQADARQARLSWAALPCPSADLLDAPGDAAWVGKFPHISSYIRDVDAPRRHRHSGSRGHRQLTRSTFGRPLCPRSAARRVAAGG